MKSGNVDEVKKACLLLNVGQKIKIGETIITKIKNSKVEWICYKIEDKIGIKICGLIELTYRLFTFEPIISLTNINSKSSLTSYKCDMSL